MRKKPIFRQRTYEINLRNAHGEYCTDLAKPLYCSGTYFYTCHPLNTHLISTHHSTMSTQSLQRGGLVLHQYLWEGIVKEVGQSPAQSACAGPAGPQLTMAPEQVSR